MSSQIALHRNRPLHRSPFAFALSVAFALGLVLLSQHSRADLATKETALDRYVAKPDTNYHYEVISTSRGEGYTLFVLGMTSQAWLTTNEVNRPIWKHHVLVVKPDEVVSDTALLLIAGGSVDKPAPTKVDPTLTKIAVATKTVVAELRLVPNEPLIFTDDPKPRTEDAIIAYTWDKFLRTGDEKWPLRLPMTKSAVRAMDTITSFCASPAGGGIKVSSFVVAGGSKRGWTTWCTAAVDKRVKAIVPIVIDVLNVEHSFEHHYAAYGFWAPAVGDYQAMKIMDWFGTPQNKALLAIEDPFSYKERLTMPKFMINASGDQFFLPDSSQFYFDQLPGTKYLRYVPNGDHSLKETDAPETLMACYAAVISNAKLPRFSWQLPADGSIQVTTQDTPKAIKVWQATNPEGRDFRLEKIGPVWKSTPLEPESAGHYTARIEAPAKGFTAFFVELTYPSAAPVPFKFTTQVRVLPDTLPFKLPPSPRAGGN